jgi:uncharacterized ferritin-like protein (DUF455 family)
MTNVRQLGDSPARDERFMVREVREELQNFPPDHPELTREFLHRQMNEEVNGLEMSARNLSDFPDAPWELRMAMARQCWDEARHIVMFRAAVEHRGGHVGQYPVMNFQYRIMTSIDNLVGRLAVQNRSFEAAGLDAIQNEIIERSKREGESDLVELFDSQLADEVQHVRYANLWVKKLTEAGGPRVLMQLARAVHVAGEALKEVAGDAMMFYPIIESLRREAGFDDVEIAAAKDLAGSGNAGL